ncbi:PREDICTED: tonsoku-like protein [Priapulus caudatus]|uniref:Tonsoku-like protein n=1 Tax=Priapulus caudatus TaxID=37621 RepID=A0ABM1F8Q7_PRICU|nr:PREDICTED: tonsoku-like protein [Priapulus caudatus]
MCALWSSNSNSNGGAAGSSERVAIEPAMRVRVNVEGKVFLIPLPRHEADERRISWLAGEASQRYYAANGRWPQLTLYTKDGTALGSDDIVTDLVTNNEEIVASVETWEMPPVAERYASACEAARTPRYNNITAALRMADSTHCLRLRDLAMRLHQARPLLRSLPGEYALTVLDLSGNRLGDEGCKELGHALPSLDALATLNLLGNEVTQRGLRELVDGGSAGGPRLPALCNLELGFNLLGDACARPLAAVLAHAPRLASLGLCACDLTAAVFQDAALAGALAALESLRCVDATWNELGVSGTRLLHGCVRSGVTVSHDVVSPRACDCDGVYDRQADGCVA